MSSSSVLRKVLSRPTNPAILPVPPRTTGNNVPKSLHKTRRTWSPNTTRTDYPIAIPAAFNQEVIQLSYGGESSSMPGLGGIRGGEKIHGVRMQMRRKKDVEKAGGIEGLLLSRPSKHLTPFGKQLRSALFDELHRVRSAALEDEREMKQGLDDAVSPIPTFTSTPSAAPVGEGDESIPTGSGR